MNFLRKGLVLENIYARKAGVVIDWGKTSDRYRRYSITSRDNAEAVRVWTDRKIEIWPIAEVTFTGA